MRAMLVLFVVVGGAWGDDAADSAVGKAKKNLEPFQGKWQIVEAKERGHAAPPGTLDKFPVTFDGNQMEMIYEGGKMMKWTVTIRPDGKPSEIDAAFPKDVEEGKIIQGIYKFEDGTLTITLGLSKNAPRPTKFESLGGGTPTLLLVLKKAK